LEDNGKTFETIHIVENPPNKEQLLDFIKKSLLPAKRFFNTSGKKYRELHVKDKVKDASVEEMAEILASDGMLIKRPIVTDGSNVTIGFKEDLFEQSWK